MIYFCISISLFTFQIYMKRLLFLFFIMITVSAFAYTRGANDLFELRTVIDSAKAVSAINAEIAQHNAPFERDIARLLDQMDRNAVAHRLASDTLASVKRLQQLYLPKVKEKELAGEFAAYYEAELNKLPLDKLFTLAKEKDVEKAHRKQNADEEIEKLVLKIKTKQVKEASKGNLEKTIVSELIDSACRHLDFLTEHLDASLKAESDSVAGLRGQLTSLLEAFDLSDYTARFNPETIPLKQINVSLANAPADYHSFAYYAEKYPYCLKESAEGKFNGIVTDKIYVFPCESALEPGWDGAFLARKLVLKSEKGSVPECVAENPGEESLTVVFQGSGEWIGSGVNCIQTLRDVWEKGGKERDGVFVSTHPDGSTLSQDLTYVLDGDKWVNRAPYNPAYLSYSDCQLLLPEMVMSKEPIPFNWYSENGQEHTSCKLIFVVGNDGKTVYVKSNPTNADLIFDPVGMVGWKTHSDMFGSGNDGLIIGFEKPSEWDGQIGYAYTLSWGGPDGTILNGKFTDIGEFWDLKRVYCFTKDSDIAYPLVLDYGTTVYGSTGSDEKLNTTKYTYKLYTSSVEVEWPESGNSRLVGAIRKWIANLFQLDKYATNSRPYRLLHDALKDCSENPKFGDDCLEIGANCTITFSNEKVVTMTGGISFYFGGSRPSYSEKCATFATDSGEELTLKMLPSAATLRPYVIAGLKKELQLTEKELREVLWLDNFERSIMDSYPIVTEDGLTFCFDVGAIGPNMAGVIKSVIPTDVAKSLVSGYPAAKFF